MQLQSTAGKAKVEVRSHPVGTSPIRAEQFARRLRRNAALSPLANANPSHPILSSFRPEKVRRPPSGTQRTSSELRIQPAACGDAFGSGVSE